MTVSSDSFRKAFKAFSDQDAYTDESVDFWINIGYTLHVGDTWGGSRDYGVMLFIAHNLVLEAQGQAAVLTGNQPLTSKGPISSASSDKLAVTYDTTAAIEKDAGHWNLTVYGTRFIRTTRMFGMGGIQL